MSDNMLIIQNIILESFFDFLSLNLSTILTFVVVFVSMILAYFNVSGKVKRKYLINFINYDELTGVFNLEKFISEGKEIILKNPQKQFCIIVVDIDSFKYINAIYGYDKGSSVLIGFSNHLKNSFSSTDIVGRIFADRFVVLTESNDGYFNDKDLIDKCKFLKYDYPLDNNYKFSISAGVYNIDDLSTSWNYMIDSAAFAMLSKKNIYGNYPCILFSEKMKKNIEVERNIVTSMESALINNEFEVYFQPEVDLKTKEIIAAEALVRWNKEDSLVLPNDFIPLFEHNLFIIKLDYYVCTEVCKFIAENKHLNLPTIAINISGATIVEPNLIDSIIDITARYDIPPSMLNIEVTESAVIEHFDLAINQIDKLRKAGFIVSMDDFGTGISTLHRLKDIPMDILKIDRDFIIDTMGNERGIIILKTIISMAHDLDMKTVAEGIETKEQLDLLNSLGCNIGQGYYFYKPQQKNDFLQVLGKSR